MESNSLRNALKPAEQWLLAGILGLAVLFRAWGLNVKLPYIYHPDEPLYITISQNIFKNKDLNPHFFNYPSLFFYLNAAAYIPYYSLGKILGVFNQPGEILSPISLVLGTTLAPLPTTVILGRMLTLIFSIGTVALVYLIGRSLTRDKAVGLLAAALMALSPSMVSHGRIITPDTFVTFFVLAAFLFSVYLFQTAHTKHYLAAGLLVGLAASTKYNSLVIALAPIAAHFLRAGLVGIREKRLYLAALMIAIGFLLFTPYALLDYQEFTADLMFEAWHYSSGHTGMDGQTLSWYLTFLWQTTGPIAILAGLEILSSLYRRHKPALLLSLFPLVYFVFICQFIVRNERTILPMLPFLFLLAANLLVRGWRTYSASQPAITRLLVMTGLLGLTGAALILPGVQTIQNQIRLSIVDSRETARIWIAEHLPPGSKIAIESYAPYIDPNQYSLTSLGYMIDHSPEWFAENGYHFLVFSQGMYGRLYEQPEKYSLEISSYEALFKRFRLLKEFNDGDFQVLIYQVSEP